MTTDDELRFLRSYLGGPRIWDAAALQDDVGSLAEQKLIEPVPGERGERGAYQITQAGRDVLEARRG